MKFHAVTTSSVSFIFMFVNTCSSVTAVQKLCIWCNVLDRPKRFYRRCRCYRKWLWPTLAASWPWSTVTSCKGHRTSQGCEEGVVIRQEVRVRSRDPWNHGGVHRTSPRWVSGPDIQPKLLWVIDKHGKRTPHRNEGVSPSFVWNKRRKKRVYTHIHLYIHECAYF